MTKQPKQFLLFCEACGFKKIIENKDELDKIPRVNIQKDIKSEATRVEQPLMTKCSKCGRGVRLKRLTKVDTNENRETKNQINGREASSP